MSEQAAPKSSKPRRHYHVVVNTPGYLPDSDDVPSFTTRRAAETYAKNEIADYRDAGFTVYGSARSGRYDMTDKSKMHDLGRVLEILECYESDCLDGEDY